MKNHQKTVRELSARELDLVGGGAGGQGGGGNVSVLNGAFSGNQIFNGNGGAGGLNGGNGQLGSSGGTSGGGTGGGGLLGL